MENKNNYLILLNELVEKFCNEAPEAGYALEYLEKADKLFDVYLKASEVAETADAPDVYLKELYEAAEKIVK